jgi:drug/metabolite transporter (DMT)-like permease
VRLMSLSSHPRAVFQALFITFVWSMSWVLIKIGLEDIPALTFAGLRYTLAFACLLPLAWRSGHHTALRRLSRAEWGRLVALGLFMYAVAQDAQFLALDRLPAVTISLLVSFTPVVVGLLGIALLAEVPTLAQWGGIALYLTGVVAYFYPAAIPTGQVIGLGFALLCLLGTALGTVIGRDVNRSEMLSPLAVTTASMGIGALIMLVTAVAAQGLPALSLQSWAIIAWLAVVHTAFTFTLWNHTQRTLPAVESGVIGNTMLIQIAILAWVFLGESLTLREIGGLALAAVGTLIAQLGRAGRPAL